MPKGRNHFKTLACKQGYASELDMHWKVKWLLVLFFVKHRCKTNTALADISCWLTSYASFYCKTSKMQPNLWDWMRVVKMLPDLLTKKPSNTTKWLTWKRKKKKKEQKMTRTDSTGVSGQILYTEAFSPSFTYKYTICLYRRLHSQSHPRRSRYSSGLIQELWPADSAPAVSTNPLTLHRSTHWHWHSMLPSLSKASPRSYRRWCWCCPSSLSVPS